MRNLTSRLKPRRARLDPPAELEGGDAASRLAALEGVSVFFTQPKPVMRSLARAARQLSVRKGEVLVSEGALNESLFVVFSGQFAVSVGSAGDTVRVAMLGPLDIFGVDSLMSAAPSSATVTAASAGEVLKIDRQRLAAHLEGDAALATQLQRVSRQRSALIDSVRRRTRIPTGVGSLIAIYSPKGGTGKTTLALNLSAALAANHPGEVALLDLGLPYNDAAFLSGMVPTTCLARLVAEIGGAFEELVLSSGLHHPSQFMLLPVALTPEEADLITPAVVSKTVETLRKEFKYVVVDCCVQLSEPVLAVLEQAQHVVVITTPKLASLKDVPRLLDVLQDVLHVPAGRIHLTINHTAPRAALGREEIETTSRRRVSAEVGYDSSAERAAIQGELAWKLRPAGPLATGATQLASRMGGGAAAVRRPRLSSVALRFDVLRRRGMA